MRITTFEEATALITVLNSIAGLRNLDPSINKTRYLFVWFYNILVLCLFNATTLFFELFHFHRRPRNLERIVYTTMKLVYALNLICTVIQSWYHSKNTIALRKRIAMMEEKFKRLEAVLNYRQLLYHLIVIAIIWVFTQLIQFGIHINWILHQNFGFMGAVSIASNIYTTNIGPLIIYDFLSYVCWLELSFKQTNYLLKTFPMDIHRIKMKGLDEDTIKPTQNKHHWSRRSHKKLSSECCFHRSRIFPTKWSPSLRHESQPTKKVHLMQEIRLLHLQLCSIVKMINTIFDSQLIELTSITLLYLVMILYYMYANIHGEQVDLLMILKILAVGLSITVCNCIKLVMTCWICEQATREAKKTKGIIHAFSLQEFDNEMKNEILQFSLQISLNQLASSKINTFQLNYDLLRQCIAFVVTYGIFMIQWENTLEMVDENSIQNETDLIK